MSLAEQRRLKELCPLMLLAEPPSAWDDGDHSIISVEDSSTAADVSLGEEAAVCRMSCATTVKVLLRTSERGSEQTTVSLGAGLQLSLGSLSEPIRLETAARIFHYRPAGARATRLASLTASSSSSSPNTSKAAPTPLAADSPGPITGAKARLEAVSSLVQLESIVVEARSANDDRCSLAPPFLVLQWCSSGSAAPGWEIIDQSRGGKNQSGKTSLTTSIPLPFPSPCSSSEVLLTIRRVFCSNLINDGHMIALVLPLSTPVASAVPSTAAAIRIRFSDDDQNNSSSNNNTGGGLADIVSPTHRLQIKNIGRTLGSNDAVEVEASLSPSPSSSSSVSPSPFGLFMLEPLNRAATWPLLSPPSAVPKQEGLTTEEDEKMLLPAFLSQLPTAVGSAEVSPASNAALAPVPPPTVLLRPEQLPRHIAIVMDGNGRWAKARGLPRSEGHAAGVEAIHRVIRSCRRLGVSFLTLYAFSAQNWSRPPEEVKALMALLVDFVHTDCEELIANGVRLLVNGDMQRLPSVARDGLKRLISVSRQNTGLTLILCLSYGGREEIACAFQAACEDASNHILDPSTVSVDTVARYLPLGSENIPDPDLLIRTSGELRISNFLLWQIAYTELHVTPALWPDFSDGHLLEALAAYAKRERRFGKTGDQLKLEAAATATARVESFTPDAKTSTSTSTSLSAVAPPSLSVDTSFGAAVRSLFSNSSSSSSSSLTGTTASSSSMSTSTGPQSSPLAGSPSSAPSSASSTPTHGRATEEQIAAELGRMEATAAAAKERAQQRRQKKQESKKVGTGDNLAASSDSSTEGETSGEEGTGCEDDESAGMAALAARRERVESSRGHCCSLFVPSCCSSRGSADEEKKKGQQRRRAVKSRGLAGNLRVWLQCAYAHGFSSLLSIGSSHGLAPSLAKADLTAPTKPPSRSSTGLSLLQAVAIFCLAYLASCLTLAPVSPVLDGSLFSPSALLPSLPSSKRLEAYSSFASYSLASFFGLPAFFSQARAYASRRYRDLKGRLNAKGEGTPSFAHGDASFGDFLGKSSGSGLCSVDGTAAGAATPDGLFSLDGSSLLTCGGETSLGSDTSGRLHERWEENKKRTAIYKSTPDEFQVFSVDGAGSVGPAGSRGDAGFQREREADDDDDPDASLLPTPGGGGDSSDRKKKNDEAAAEMRMKSQSKRKTNGPTMSRLVQQHAAITTD